MEFGGYFRFLVALVFVLGMIGLLAVLARRSGLGFPAAARPGKDRRLQVVEVAPVDGRRRLVLIRRDNIEHLVLLGQSTELLIESGIKTGAASLGESINLLDSEKRSSPEESTDGEEQA